MSKAITKKSGSVESSDKETCVVCYRDAKIYSIGECDHPVCHQCSTRMRVICNRTECPICRKDMALVVFMHVIQLFSRINHHAMKCERRYMIYFEDDEVMRAYDRLLEHMCVICRDRPKFKSFKLLRDHMRKIHEFFYCDLCVDNLKIFTYERKFYNRSELAQHRRVGDYDDTSHKGHPLCEFCDNRFLDNDELFRHLRRDHFFCHFCDADGLHNYYNDYDALRDHFRSNHFLCEEDDCRNERFTSAFRSKIDYQAHKTQYHSHGMSKTEVRQARTVDISFGMTSHRPQPHEKAKGHRKGQDNKRRGAEPEPDLGAAALPPPEQSAQVNVSIDISCAQDFPSLNKGSGSGLAGDGEGGSKSIAHRLAQKNKLTVKMGAANPMSEEEFPSLVPGSSAKGAKSSNSSKPASASHGRATQVSNLPSKDTTKAKPKQPRESGTKPMSPSRPLASEDFPSLPKSSRIPNPSVSWVANQNKKEKKASKRSQDSNNNSTNSEKLVNGSANQTYSFQTDDFPTLGTSSKVTVLSKKTTKIKNPKEREKTGENKENKTKKGSVEPGNKTMNSPSSASVKKKNKTMQKFTIEEEDQDGPVENFNMTREGDYVSVINYNSSNIRSITADDLTLQNSISNPNPASFSSNDFPSLAPSNGVNNNKSTKTTKPLSNLSLKAKAKAPPGFSQALIKKEVPQQPVNQKQTKKKLNPKYTYSYPPDFATRNQNLIASINFACKGDSNLFNTFKTLAGLLRSGEMPGQKFYATCRETLGVDMLLTILPELLALLPDIDKQQAVLQAYRSLDNNNSRGICFAVCAVCQQVLVSDDFTSHTKGHELTKVNFQNLHGTQGSRK